MPSAREVFRRSGLRCTRQRAVLFEALRATKMHPTAEELHETVRTEEPGLSLATVYNTLEALAERGLVRRIPSPRGNGPSRYDADISHHVHLTLPDGRVVDLPEHVGARIAAAVPSEMHDWIRREYGVDLGPVNIELTAGAPRRHSEHAGR